MYTFTISKEFYAVAASNRGPGVGKDRIDDIRLMLLAVGCE
jgi:hypothetical protein